MPFGSITVIFLQRLDIFAVLRHPLLFLAISRRDCQFIVVLQVMPISDYLMDDNAKYDPPPLVQNPLDQTDAFSSNDENDIDEETMCVST